MVSIVYTSTAAGVSKAGVLELDAALSLQHQKAVEATSYPVESGATISDHAIRKPDSFRLEGLFSDTRMDGLGEGGRVSSARSVLESILEARQAVSVETFERSYPSMLMVDLQFPRDPTTGESLRFSASFQQILTVATEIVALPRAPKPGKANGGKKPVQKASEPEVRKVSTLKALADFVRGKNNSPGAPAAE